MIIKFALEGGKYRLGFDTGKDNSLERVRSCFLGAQDAAEQHYRVVKGTWPPDPAHGTVQVYESSKSVAPVVTWAWAPSDVDAVQKFLQAVNDARRQTA